MNYTNIHNRLVTFRKEVVKNGAKDGPMLKMLDRKISAAADLLPQQRRVVAKRKAISKRENAMQIANSGNNC